MGCGGALSFPVLFFFAECASFAFGTAGVHNLSGSVNALCNL
jgi:hypothetical protein